MSNKTDLFLIIYRNKYLRIKIFHEIKISNKKLKYIRYSFYDAPLDFIIKTRNKQLLIEKLNLFSKFINNNSNNNSNNNNLNNNNNDNNNNNNNNNDNTEINDIYKYYIEFNSKDFELLLEWKDLDLSTFIEFINTFSIKLKELNAKTINKYIQILIIENGVNVEILEYILKETNINNIIEKEGVGGIYEECKTDLIENFFKKATTEMSMKMFNYLFEFDENGNLKYRITFFKEFTDTFIFNNIIESINKTQSNNQLISAFFSLLPDRIFKNLELCNPPTQDKPKPRQYSFFKNTISNCNGFNFSRLINTTIRMNNLEILKLILSKFIWTPTTTTTTTTTTTNCNNNNNNNIQLSIIEIYGFKISINTLRNLEIDISIFNGTDDLMLPLYKVMVEKVVSDELFTINQKSSVTVNGPYYSDYVLELLNRNNLSLDKMKNNIIFKYKCIRDKESDFNNHLLLNAQLINIDFFRCKVMNENLELFGFYLVAFGFDKMRLLEAVDLGFEKMVTFMINIGEMYLGGNEENHQEESLKLYLDLLLKSLPTDKHNGYQYLFDLVLPIINNKIIKYENFNRSLFHIVNNRKLPLNPIKRKKYVENISKITNFFDLKLNHFLNNYYSINYHPTKSNLPSSIPDYMDFNKNSLNIIKTTPDHIFYQIFKDCLEIGNLKLLKKILKLTKVKQTNSLLEICLNYNFKLINFILLNLNFLTIEWPPNNSFFKLLENFIKLSINNNSNNNNNFENYSLLELIFGIGKFKNYKFFNLFNFQSNGKKLDNQVFGDRALILFQLYLLKNSCSIICKRILDLESVNCITNHHPQNLDFIRNKISGKSLSIIISLNYSSIEKDQLFHKFGFNIKL
ncbi:hypothetical protein ACTFIR_002975 [Dictyostelium discoideum]